MGAELDGAACHIRATYCGDQRAKTVTHNHSPAVDQDRYSHRSPGKWHHRMFELVVCAAVGQSSRQYEAGLAALAEAMGSDDAP